MSRSEQMVTGVILAVQEERFRLQASDGKGYLLTLHRFANARAEDLHRWHLENRPVLVTYEGKPNLESGVAHRIDVL